MISGSLVAVDSSEYGLLAGSISVDLWANPNNQGYLRLSDLTCIESSQEVGNIESLKGVKEVAPLPFVSGISYLNEKGDIYIEETNSGSIVFLPSDPNAVIRNFGIDGEAPSSGSVAVPSQVATDLGLNIDSDVICSLELRNYTYIGGNYTYISTYVNFTLPVSEIWKQERAEGQSPSSLRDSVEILGLSNPLLLSISDANGILSIMSTVSADVYPGIYYLVWVDRASVINLADVSGTTDRLLRLENQIRTVFAVEGIEVYVGDEWISRLTDVNLDLGRTKLLLLGLSIPVVALGTYFASIGIELGTAVRRREMGILKARGGSSRQLLGLLLTESLVLGSVAGGVGLVFGTGFSRILLDAAGSFIQNSPANSLPSVFQLEWQTVALSIGFGILLMFISAFRPMRRLARTNPAEAIHRYNPETAETRYNPRLDILALVIVAISSLVILVPKGAIGGGRSVVLQAVVYAVVAMGAAIAPLTPFILSLSLARLITRSSKKLYKRFARLLKPWTKNLHSIVDANVMRNVHRASSLCVVISLGLSLTVFASFIMESSMLHEAGTVEFEIGTDIRGEASSWSASNSSFDASLSTLNSIDSCSNVDASCIFLSVTMRGETSSANAAVFNPEAYLNAVRENALSSAHISKTDIRRLTENGTALATKEFARTTYLEEGDLIILSLNYFDESSGIESEWSFPLRVVGVVDGVPGLSDRTLFIGEKTLGFIPSEALGNSVGVLVKIDLEDSYPSVSHALQALFDDAGFSSPVIEALQTELELVKGKPSSGALARFMYAENALIVMTMSVGVGMLIFVNIVDREYELGCILARGASRSQLRILLTGESMTLVIIGVFVGAPIGLLAAASFCSFLNTQTSSVVGYVIVPNFTTIIIMIAYIGFIIASAFLAADRASATKIPRVLRMRGG
jgi:hypothetical protein